MALTKVRKLDLRDADVIEQERQACQAWSAAMLLHNIHVMADKHGFFILDPLQAMPYRYAAVVQEADYRSYARLSLTNNTSIFKLTRGDMKYLGILRVAKPPLMDRFRAWVMQ